MAELGEVAGRFSAGIRLFEGVDAGRLALEPVRAEPTQRVTHLTCAVRERQLSRPHGVVVELPRQQLRLAQRDTEGPCKPQVLTAPRGKPTARLPGWWAGRS